MKNMELINAGLSATSFKTKSETDDLLLLKEKIANLVKNTNQFTYIITHDLQAPLRMVTGFLELLERKYAEKLDADAQKYIAYSIKGANRMKSLIFDLLEYSRLNTADHIFDKVDIKEVLEEAINTLTDKISASDAIINTGLLPIITGDRKLMLQYFTQVLDNAIKYRGSNKPIINVQSSIRDGKLDISISDNGIGFDQAFYETIFIIFKKLHPEAAGYEGNGIGLALCKKIAEIHNGWIDVISKPGKGSTFILTIPNNAY